jgi:HD-GYP domain-containing protein (c-di-GMP phosphodiesterase class II)
VPPIRPNATAALFRPSSVVYCAGLTQLIPRQMNTTKAVAVALDERDSVTSRRCSRVAGLSLELGRACSLSEHDLYILRTAAAFHDVGKIGIPDTMLLKVTRFTEDDWVVIKTHSAKSQRIILAAGLDDGELIGLVARHHHERYDGTGYPDGLAGEAIPTMARIVALADTYDAMARTRVYRHALSHDHIMRVLYDEQGRQHDSYLFPKFVTLITNSWHKARADRAENITGPISN